MQIKTSFPLILAFLFRISCFSTSNGISFLWWYWHEEFCLRRKSSEHISAQIGQICKIATYANMLQHVSFLETSPHCISSLLTSRKQQNFAYCTKNLKNGICLTTYFSDEQQHLFSTFTSILCISNDIFEINRTISSKRPLFLISIFASFNSMLSSNNRNTRSMQILLSNIFSDSTNFSWSFACGIQQKIPIGLSSIHITKPWSILLR